MKNMILNWLENRKELRFESFELQKFLERETVFNYEIFVNFLDQLVKDEIIKPVKSKKKNHRTPSIYNLYQKIRQKVSIPQNVIQSILLKYHPSMNMDFYIKNYDFYEKDKPFLLAIDEFLKNPDDEIVTINERSFQLFHYEKWLSTIGETMMKRIGVTLEQLRCEVIYEPFFYYQCVTWNKSSKVNILIVENKDTFGSFKYLFQNGYNIFKDIQFDLLIYGEGDKILRSIESIWDIDGAKRKKIMGYYFGDLDPVGIEICLSLISKEVIPVVSMSPFYNEMLKRFQPALRTSTPFKEDSGIKQKYKEEHAAQFAEFLDGDYKEVLFQMLKMHYIPQEALNRSILKELLRKGKENE